MKRLAGGGMIAGMVIAWATYYAASKWMVDATGSALTAGFLLRAAAFVFLTAQLLFQRKLPALFKQGKATRLLLLIGLMGFLLDLCANIGYRHGSLGAGTVLLKTDVLMVNLATVFIARKKLYLSDWAGTGVMLIGVLMVLGINVSGVSFNAYDIFFLISALFVTVNAFLIKKAQTKFDVDPDVIGYYNNFVVMACFLIGTLVSGDMTRLNAIADGNLPSVVLLGGAAQTLIYFFYYRNLKRYEVWMVKLYLLFMPIVSCLFGVFFFGERLTEWKIAGMTVVLIGAGLILARDHVGRRRVCHRGKEGISP